MPSVFCLPMDPLPNISDPDGICYQRPTIVKMRNRFESWAEVTGNGAGRLKDKQDWGEALARLMRASAPTT